MLCPRCGTRNTLGSRRCSQCLMPFTRSAAQRDGQFAGPPGTGSGVRTETGAGVVVEDDDPWSGVDHINERAARAYDRGPTRARRPNGCLMAAGVLAIVVVTLLVAVLATANLIVKPRVRDAAIEDIRSGVGDEVQREIATQISGAPSGEVTVSEAEVNQRIDKSGDLDPLDDVSVAFTPDGIDVDLSAYGLNGSYHAVARAENGTIVIDGGDIDGALGLVVPAGELEDAINAEIAAALQAAGYRVESVSHAEDELVLALAQ